MRYQYPADSPLVHYWEEETVSVDGARLPNKNRRFLAHFLKEIILANLIFLYQITLLQAAVSTRSIFLELIQAIDIAAILKRTIDIIGATIGMILSIPIWIIVPIAIAIDSPGPVFYLQERVGVNRRRRERRGTAGNTTTERRSSTDRRKIQGYGKNFMIMKFRSMHVDAEKMTGPVWASRNDNRITRVGKILRAARIDEVPQLINVLIGNMSLVGPRPERPFFVSDLNGKVNGYSTRFMVKPGITGLAQVEHKYDESIEDVAKKITYDLRYISNCSIVQDIRIILKTVVVVFTMRGM